MAKKKRKLKKGVIFIFAICLIAFFSYFIIKNFIGFDIKNIYISNNTLFSDQYIIDVSGLENYPNFYTTSSNSIRKKLKKSVYIKDVKVKKRFFQKVYIDLLEYDILFLNAEDNNYILENGNKIKRDTEVVDVPILINYVPDQKFDTLIEKYLKIDKNVRKKISEIKYDPNEYDEDRFLLYMNDENYIYITLTKLDVLNKYNDAIKQLEGKKGILYLDSGNYFQIMQ